ncbi:hypothetical protein GK047_07000 [Paenibacillus sp. SYP-B3998]|uniref:Uncharacterized protein n=1 Tax=Paenibacillus sp. SYP-B3998 TaxID=2678564 RepID=A0A6G3ZUH0_9BACL|nr:hypothetical protein [Paenibacillus sp. SYP-B3998]NEW05765.1 hypothetical protein [Paenibacillus sp. SYP-B3998]
MTYSFIIEPKTFNTFETEDELVDKCKDWNLLSEKASKTKAFFYKGNGMNLPCSIIGYVDKFTAVIAFDNKQEHCIHPSYLKEMQASTYGQKLSAAVEESVDQRDATPVVELEMDPIESQPINEVETKETSAKEPPKGKAKKEKAQKIQLPEEKVKMTATVKEFTTVPNNFSDNDDEVVIYEAVSILEPAMEIGVAWSSHSATLKKVELNIGDTISFECKIVAKKLTKHPVPYKINNPAKIQKEES